MSLPIRSLTPFLPRWRAIVKLAGLAGVLFCACSKHNGSSAADSSGNPSKDLASKENTLIAQARAALGPEDKLLAVQTLAMTGKIPNPAKFER